MSTIRTVNIQHPSSSTPSITMDSTGAMTGSFPYPNRNLIYNGAMQINQRSASVANITTGNYYTADRWNLGITNLGTWTQTIENDAPTGSGFRKSLKMLCTTADPSLAASDLCYFFQRLEGQDCQRIAKGTANAQSLSLSFWVKANVTGTYIARIYDIDNARSISSTYTITANATWERKTITFLPDTTGVFDNDASASLELQFFFAVGTDYTSGTLQTTWGSAVASTAAPGQVNLASTVNNYWQITGVQLEASPVATPFEFKSFGQELRECQRYFCKTADQGIDPKQNNGDTNSLYVVGQVNGLLVSTIWKFPVSMRAAPTVTTFNPSANNANWTANPSSPAAVVRTANTEMASISAGPTNVVAGNGFYLSAQAAIEL